MDEAEVVKWPKANFNQSINQSINQSFIKVISLALLFQI